MAKKRKQNAKWAPTYHNMFINRVCSQCGICTTEHKFPKNAIFCLVMLQGNKKRFYKIMEHVIMVRKLTNDKALKDFATFEGFCGLMCNSFPKCPFNGKCNVLFNVITCSIDFAEQAHLEVNEETKRELYKSFCGIAPEKIGTKYSPHNRNKTYGNLGKKKKRKIKGKLKELKRSLNLVVAEIQLHQIREQAKNNSKKDRSKAITTIICNNDEAWKNQLDIYLGKVENENETNNKQPPNTAKHSGGSN